MTTPTVTRVKKLINRVEDVVPGGPRRSRVRPTPIYCAGIDAANRLVSAR